MNEEYIKKLETENKMLIEALKQLEELKKENEKLKGFNEAQARLLSKLTPQDSGGWTSDYERKSISKKGSSYYE